MNSDLIVILVLATIGSLIAMFTRHEGASFLFQVISFFIFWTVIIILYRNVSLPSKIFDTSYVFFDGRYNPFEDGKVYEIYWKNRIDGEYLFRANLINRENKENIKEVFSCEKSLPESEYCAYINGKFYPISDSLKKNIFRLDLDQWQIRKELNLIK